MGQRRDLADAAVETIVEQPEEREAHLPPLFLPGQLEKARHGLEGHQPVEAEIAQALRTELVHLPVLRHSLEDCLVHPAGFEFRGGAFRIRDLAPAHLLSGEVLRVPEAIYCMTGVSQTYFGHWLQDACATALLQRDGEAVLLTNPPEWPHAAQYLEAFGLSPRPWHLLRVDRLTIHEDFSQGSSKRRRYAELRRRLAAAFGDRPSGGPRVYFRRGASGAARVIVNEEAVIARLTARGFDLFDLAGASACDIHARFRGAEFVVSMDGSHLNHCYFSMPAGARMMTFVPGDRFTMNQVGYCAAARLRYGFLVADPVPGGYAVALDELDATLDLMGL